jgi:trehalose 6-phosphate phosphatase
MPERGERWAVFLDVDGTLIAIAATPEAARPAAKLVPILERLTCALEGALALVSGRSLASIDVVMAPLHLPAAGLHGAERRRADGSLTRAVVSLGELDRLRPRLKDWAASEPRLRLEDKGGSLAVHYRLAPAAGPAIRQRARGIARQEPGLRVIEGRKVVEFQPRGADKGRAIAAFLAEPPFLGRTPVFAGDDVTDEDGFAEVERRGGISIQIANAEARSQRRRARYRLPSVAALHRWLAAVAEALAAERASLVRQPRGASLAASQRSAKCP